MRSLTIDLHTHVLPENWPDLEQRYGYPLLADISAVRRDHGIAVLITLIFLTFQIRSTRIQLSRQNGRELLRQLSEIALTLSENSRLMEVHVKAQSDFAASAVFFSLLPLILDRAFSEDHVWRASMAFYGAEHLGGIAYHYLRIRGNNLIPPWIPTLMLVGSGLALGQLSAAFVGPIRLVEPFYLFVLVWHLGVGGLYFGLLIFTSHGRGAA